MNQPKNEPVVIIARITPMREWEPNIPRKRAVHIVDGVLQTSNVRIEPVVPRED
jgi:hypothetical protein